MSDTNDKPTVFISYKREDAVWKDRLLPHLQVLEQQGQIVLWHDGLIGKGADWLPEIEQAMARTAVAVCLISADYLASDFIIKEEIPFLLHWRKDRGMLLLPVYLKPCPWKAVPWLRNIQMFPGPNEPLGAIKDPVEVDQKLADIADLIFERVSDPEFRLPEPTPRWAELPEDRVAIEHLPKTGTDIFGRTDELALLDSAWDSDQTNIITFVAWGGVGKSALVNKWLALIEKENYRGARRVYAWSFYSQGTGLRVSSADLFIDRALRWFGDAAMADTNRSPWDKGERLAELVRQKRTLLILDGLEPLQSSFEHDRGQVTDSALAVLLQELAKKNPGLCVITTRETLAGLEVSGEAMVQKDLDQVSDAAGRALLHAGGVRGSDAQLEKLTRDFGNHALAVNLLVAYLQDKPGRHAREAATIGDLDIPPQEGRHPRRVMEAFAEQFGESPELNVLNIMGLFDRPATAQEINWVRTRTDIPGLNDHIRWVIPQDWDRVLDNVRRTRLIAAPSYHNLGGLDAHPLVREHFAERLREANEEAWKQGHSQLYEFLSMAAPRLPDTLEEMAPLFAAVTHGCHAGRHEEALDVVYIRRILRGDTFFASTKLGTLGAELTALCAFFNPPWHGPVSGLRASFRGFVLNQAGSSLRAVGRLRDAAQPFKAALQQALAEPHWEHAATAAGNLSDTFLTLGEMSQALDYARQSAALADQSGDAFRRMIGGTTLADTLHQAGRLGDAKAAFLEAERMQVERQPEYSILYSVQGFTWCDLLLDLGEHQEVLDRATKTLPWAIAREMLLDIARDHLSLGQARLLAVRHEGTGDWTEAAEQLDQAVDGLRKAGQQNFVPRGFLARAEYHRLRAQHGQGEEFFDRARRDLDEAISIATRGQMRLHEADAHLEYARLEMALGNAAEARTHLETARDMINEMGYHRRDAEVLIETTRLELLEGDQENARKTLAAAKAKVDEMGCHRWDPDLAELAEKLK